MQKVEQVNLVGEKDQNYLFQTQAGQIQQSERYQANVNFNITVMDTRGFDEALQENRGTITAIINNALTENEEVS